MMYNCRCGGILLKHPPQESRSTGTTAKPFLALERNLAYAVLKWSSNCFIAFSDFLLSFSSSFSVSAIMLSSSAFLALRSFRSEEHTSELQSRPHLVCRLLLEKKNKIVHVTI